MFTAALEFALSITTISFALSLIYRAFHGEYTIYDFARQVIVFTMLVRFLLMHLPFWARMMLMMCLTVIISVQLI